MSTVAVVRHAKSDRPPGVADFYRPLRTRGIRDARVGGDWLRDTIGRPELVISSPARRAAQTASALLEAYGDDPPPIRYEDRLYSASVTDLLDVVAELTDTPVALVGHNPSVTELVGALTGEHLELRTCGIAVISLEPAASGIPRGAGTLLSSSTPRAGG